MTASFCIERKPEPEIECIFARRLFEDVGPISAGGSSIHSVHVGPFYETLIGEVMIGIRVFTDVGEFYTAQFDITHESGEVSELESIFDD